MYRKPSATSSSSPSSYHDVTSLTTREVVQTHPHFTSRHLSPAAGQALPPTIRQFVQLACSLSPSRDDHRGAETRFFGGDHASPFFPFFFPFPSLTISPLLAPKNLFTPSPLFPASHTPASLLCSACTRLRNQNWYSKVRIARTPIRTNKNQVSKSSQVRKARISLTSTTCRNNQRHQRSRAQLPTLRSIDIGKRREQTSKRVE